MKDVRQAQTLRSGNVSDPALHAQESRKGAVVHDTPADRCVSDNDVPATKTAERPTLSLHTRDGFGRGIGGGRSSRCLCEKSTGQELSKRPKRTVLLSVHEQVKWTLPQVWI